MFSSAILPSSRVINSNIFNTLHLLAVDELHIADRL